MKHFRHATELNNQGIWPPVFRGILLIGMIQGLRIPAAFFVKAINSEDAFYNANALLAYTALLAIVLLIINLIAIWATLPAANRGVWEILRKQRREHPMRRLEGQDNMP